MILARMGEMADFYNEQVEKMENLRFSYRTGDMSDLDAYEHGIIDELGHEIGYDYENDQSKKCKFCGKSSLQWKKINERWFLHELDGNVHHCPKHPLPLEVLKELVNKKKMNTTQLLPIPTWDEQFMTDVYKWARKSKDPRTKIGSVLVYWDEKDGFAHGYNGIARSVRDLPERMERPEKYFWMSHAERNVIYHCARSGRATEGATMFTQGVPCCDCADAVIQAGIVEVVVHKQWQEFERKFNWDKWNDSAKRSEIKFQEAGVKIRVFDGILGVQGVLDGKIIDV